MSGTSIIAQIFVPLKVISPICKELIPLNLMSQILRLKWQKYVAPNLAAPLEVMI